MPSVRSEQAALLPAKPPRRHRLSTRIALVAVWSAALGALMAALLAIGTVDRLLAAQADQRLRGAVVELAGELDEDRDKTHSEWLRQELDDENEELSASAIALAVFHRDSLMAGVADGSPPAAGSCATRGAVGQRVRACARSYRSWLLVASQPSDSGYLRWTYLFAALGAMLLGGGTGAILSARLAPWAARPLATLTQALRSAEAVPASEPEFGPSSACEDVESVRMALEKRSIQTRQLLHQAHRFAADAAHELRTPLTSLRVELDLLREETNAPKAALDRALGRVSRLSELVDRLLVLALPVDQSAAAFETISMSDVVEEVAAELREPERAQLELRLKCEGLVRGDAALLHSLVSNAVQNALRFSAGEPVTLSVEQALQGSVTLQVRDRGPGIAPELREQVFQPFSRIMPQPGQGHGLGLALIHQIAQVHGGEARFLDVEPGACLQVRFPSWKAP